MLVVLKVWAKTTVGSGLLERNSLYGSLLECTLCTLYRARFSLAELIPWRPGPTPRVFSAVCVATRKAICFFITHHPLPPPPLPPLHTVGFMPAQCPVQCPFVTKGWKCFVLITFFTCKCLLAWKQIHVGYTSSVNERELENRTLYCSGVVTLFGCRTITVF